MNKVLKKNLYFNFSFSRLALAGWVIGLIFSFGIDALSVNGQPKTATALKVLWQIGKVDQDYSEFAIAGHYGEYQRQFGGKPIIYKVGASNPAKDWPYIQPGSLDGWAGGTSHARTISFTLTDEPHGVFTLRISLVDVHPSSPPVLTLSIKGQEGQFSLAAGVGDKSLSNPKAGKSQMVEAKIPAAMLKKGTNEWIISSEEGSWLLYDAVTLLYDAQRTHAETASITQLDVKATPLFVKKEGKIGRVVNVVLSLSDNGRAPVLQALVDGNKRDIPVQNLPLFGPVRTELIIPDSNQPQMVSITANLGSQSRTTSIRVEPTRKWTIYIAAAAHTDVGYTDIQAKTMEVHNRNTDKAIELARRYPDYRWNLEVALQAETYLATRSGQKREDFLRLAREGRIGVMALYANMLTGLSSHEEACHMFQYAADLHRNYGIPLSNTAMLTDVPTADASFPMIAANSGVRYFAQGINNGRAPTFRPYMKNPCWWQGPDGSRVLTVFSEGYGQARSWGVCSSLSRTKIQTTNKLDAFEKRIDYPYDAVFVHGQEGDNTGLDPRIAEIVKQWNELYAYPKIVLSNGPDFFEHIEKKFGDQLPVITGGAGTYWEDGAGTSARETALNRNAHENLGDAVRLATLTRRIAPTAAYPSKDFAQAWRNVMLFDEHTWGASPSISDPDSPNVIAQWNVKAQFAKDADSLAHSLLEQGIKGFSALVRSDSRSLIVINSSGWNRSDILQVKLPDGITITEPGVESCDWQGETLALVKDVPACGYRVLRLGKGTRVAAQPVAGTILDSRSFQVAFDTSNGAVTSVIDQDSKRELVDAKASYRLNQYLYVRGGKGTNIEYDDSSKPSILDISSPKQATFKRFKLGALGEAMIVETSTAMTPKLTSMVMVWNGIKRLDLDNRITKIKTYEKEAGYFAFPFAADKPSIRYEIPVGVMDVSKDMLPGACLDWFTVQHFVEVSNVAGAITWSTPDAPLACFQDINRGLWKTSLPIVNGHIYGYVFNNYWWTNYCAGQGGELRFRFSITSRAASDLAASARFGADVSSPLQAVIADANPGGVLQASSAGLLTIAESNAQLIGLSQAADGNGTIVRLWETSGLETTVHINAKALGIRIASACNLVEVGASPLEVKDGVVSVPLRAHGVATVRMD